jgi:hypothetical protein
MAARRESVRVGQQTFLTHEQERTWIQCLHPKEAGWVAEPDDENYEIDAKLCFVTGIGKEGVGEYSARGFQPVKHGVTECHITNQGGLSVRQQPFVWTLRFENHC